MPVTVWLLKRSVDLTSPENEFRYALMCELGIAEHSAGDRDAANTTFVQAIAGAAPASHRGAELRVRIEAAYLRLLAEPEGAARDLLTLTERPGVPAHAMPSFVPVSKRPMVVFSLSQAGPQEIY